MIKVRRVYDDTAPAEGARILVERLWPRGLKKAELRLDGWAKEVAPSGELRRWFGHDVAKWDEFRSRYVAELDAKPEAWRPLLEVARDGTVTLLYSARDEEHNSAVVLQDYLQRHL